jgi:hypothetical protein|tara:strand:- start:2882 stop:3340 length:459 start_codon:yes stop_codon:yes gene_type:complete
MEIRRSLVAMCTPDEMFSWVEDLACYPEWMRMVHVVTPDATGGPGEALAWDVELRAQVGPFARSKRLRMVRTEHDVPHRVTFERSELDERSHSVWVLRATIDPAPQGQTGLTMELNYGGGLWTGAVLGRVLDDEVRRGSETLRQLVTETPTR